MMKRWLRRSAGSPRRVRACTSHLLAAQRFYFISSCAEFQPTQATRGPALSLREQHIQTCLDTICITRAGDGGGLAEHYVHHRNSSML